VLRIRCLLRFCLTQDNTSKFALIHLLIHVLLMNCLTTLGLSRCTWSCLHSVLASRLYNRCKPAEVGQGMTHRVYCCHSNRTCSSSSPGCTAPIERDRKNIYIHPLTCPLLDSINRYLPQSRIHSAVSLTGWQKAPILFIINELHHISSGNVMHSPYVVVGGGIVQYSPRIN